MTQNFIASSVSSDFVLKKFQGSLMLQESLHFYVDNIQKVVVTRKASFNRQQNLFLIIVVLGMLEPTANSNVICF